MAHSTEYAHLEADALGIPEDALLFKSAEVGSRAATRVRVASPQGSAFDGRRGVVVRDVPGSTTIMVRLDNPPGVRGPESTLPFGRGELAIID